MNSIWPKAKLSEVAPSKPLKVKNTDAKVWQLNLNHIESNTGRLIHADIQPYSEAGTSTHWFDERHVLYSKLRPYLNKVLLPDQKGLATTELVPMLPNKELLNRKYLAFYLRSKQFVDWVSAQTAGAKMPRVSMKVFWDHEIPLPPLAEQQKIAAILDTADQLRQKDQQLVEHYTALGQSLFLEMFGDPLGNPRGWKKVEMGELFTIQRGGSPRPINNFLGGTYPWIKIGDATKGSDIYLESTKEHITEDGLSKTRLLPKGSIIFANCGVSLGFARIITFDGCIHDGWLSFSEIDDLMLNKIFLLKALNSITRYFRQTAPDGTQPNLNTSIMKKFELIMPPIDLQNTFVQGLELIEQQKQQAQESLEKSEALFNSLLQRAFKGELTQSTAA